MDVAVEAALDPMVELIVDSRNDARMLASTDANGPRAEITPVRPELETPTFNTLAVFTASPEGAMVKVAVKPNGRVLRPKKKVRAVSVPVAVTVMPPEVRAMVTGGSEKVSGTNVPPVARAQAN
jgi:hypothetical protein